MSKKQQQAQVFVFIQRDKQMGLSTQLTVIFAWISYFLPFFPINLQLSSSTLADTIWKRSWFLEKKLSNVRISCFNVFKHAIRLRDWRFWDPNYNQQFSFTLYFNTILRDLCTPWTNQNGRSLWLLRKDLIGDKRWQSGFVVLSICIDNKGIAFFVLFYLFFPNNKI